MIDHSKIYCKVQLSSVVEPDHEFYACTSIPLCFLYVEKMDEVKYLKVRLGKDAKQSGNRYFSSETEIIEEIPKEEVDDITACHTAVLQNGLLLKYVSDRLKNNYKICMAAVKQNGYALEHASEEMREDPEICAAAVAEFASAICHARVFPPKMCMYAVTQCWTNLQFIPKTMVEYEHLCLEAISGSPDAIKYVDFYYVKNKPRFCMEAVHRTGLCFKYIPDVYKTKELFMEALYAVYKREVVPPYVSGAMVRMVIG